MPTRTRCLTLVSPLCERSEKRGTGSTRIVLRLKLRSLLLFHSIISVTVYVTMIEGLGKGVKYSLFVANAIIFVSVVCLFVSFNYQNYY